MSGPRPGDPRAAEAPGSLSRTAREERPGVGALVVLDPTSRVPPFEQVRAQIARAIDGGFLPAASRLPTVRMLAGQLGLAVNTVARAYRELELEGLVVTEGRHGSFVAGESSAVREQAAIEARAFIARMGDLGIGMREMTAILRREAGTSWWSGPASIR